MNNISFCTFLYICGRLKIYLWNTYVCQNRQFLNSHWSGNRDPGSLETNNPWHDPWPPPRYLSSYRMGKGWGKLASEGSFSFLGGFTVKETPSLRIPQRSCNRFVYEQTDRCSVYFRSKTRVRRNVGHHCKFINDSIPRGLEIVWIFREIRCFRWCFATLPVWNIQTCKWLDMFSQNPKNLIDLKDFFKFC